MDWHHLEVEVDMEFWPVEHPMEPPDEDRPVKCPMPDSTVINVRMFQLFSLNSNSIHVSSFILGWLY